MDKKEYVNPHRLGCGLKLVEQVGAYPGTGAALLILAAAQRETRGGGDLDMTENWHGPERMIPPHNVTPGPMPESYPAIAASVIGRWAGDRIAIVGDYAEDEDLQPDDHASLISTLCRTEEEKQKQIAHLRTLHSEEHRKEADDLEAATVFTDVTDAVCTVIEHELRGTFKGDGWRDFVEVDSK